MSTATKQARATRTTKFTFQVGEAVNEVPTVKIHRAGQYEAIFSQVSELEAGQHLPVTMESNEGALSLQRAAKQRGVSAEKRGNVVYLSLASA